MQSFRKKISTLIVEGLDPVQEGIYNFNNEYGIVENLANKRAKKCIKCPYFVDEPISFLAVEDIRIPSISNKMCDECGCALPYKLRQSKSKCFKWLE